MFENVMSEPISPVVNGPISPAVKGAVAPVVNGPVVPVVNLIGGAMGTAAVRGMS